MKRLLALMMLLTACAPVPAPVRTIVSDPTAERGYRDAVTELSALVRQADLAYRQRQPNKAAALIQKAEPVMTRVLAVPKPTLAAVEASSGLDQLYGRMLLANRHYGWARLQFQKNLARWKHWEPQTPETIRLRQEAEAAIAECDRHME